LRIAERVPQPNGFPSPLIVLCPPRSFSSLLCAMLGQHRQLYGFPELNLFLTDEVGQLLDIDDRVRQASEYWGIYTVGLIRAIAELEFGGQTEPTMRLALASIQDRRVWLCADLPRHLLAHIAPRIGVDKSPRTALSGRSLGRMIGSCPSARILHLTRHPVSCVTSMMTAAQPTHRHGLVLERDPERASFCAELWCEAHERILDLGEARDRQSVLLVRGEDLVADPDPALARIATWLGVDSDPAALQAMRHPERSPFANPGPWPSWGDQDPHFLASPTLDRSAGARVTAIPDWWCPERGLARRLRALADRFGYAVDPTAVA
jgi:Sulfotransferase family